MINCTIIEFAVWPSAISRLPEAALKMKMFEKNSIITRYCNAAEMSPPLDSCIPIYKNKHDMTYFTPSCSLVYSDWSKVEKAHLFNACCQKLLCARWTHTDAKSLSSEIELGDVVIQRYTLLITFCFLVVLHPDLFFSTHIRDALNQQLRRRQASIWPEAHAISQPWTNVVSETHVCHLWRPLFWWVGALRAGLAAVKQQPDTVYFMVIPVWILPHCWMFLAGDESQSALLVEIKMCAFMLLFVFWSVNLFFFFF